MAKIFKLGFIFLTFANLVVSPSFGAVGQGQGANPSPSPSPSTTPDPSPSPTPTASPTPKAPIAKELPVDCQITRDPNGIDFNAIKKTNGVPTFNVDDIPKYIEENFSNARFGGTTTSIINANNFPDRAVMRVICHLDPTMDPPNRMDLEMNFESEDRKRCDNDATANGLCLEYAEANGQAVRVTRNMTPVPVTLRSSWVEVGKLIYRNRGTDSETISPGDVSVNMISASGSTLYKSKSVSLSQNVSVSSVQNFQNPTCRIFVDGTLNQGGASSVSCNNSTCNPPVTEVYNSDLALHVALHGVALGAQAITSPVKWQLPAGGSFKLSGASNENALWEAPPANKTSTIKATVQIGRGLTTSCAVQLHTSGNQYQITLKKSGDCQFFSALRNYYFKNPANTGPQNPASYPKISLSTGNALYGMEVPFRGFLNGASSLTGKLTIGTGGAITMPPPNSRRFSGAVVIARRVSEPAGNTTTVPVPPYYGKIDFNNYPVLRMNRTTDPTTGQLVPEPADSEQLRFQVFLPRSQLVNSQDVRGAAGYLPIWSIADAMQDKSPADYYVPLTGESCAFPTRLSPPARSDKELPSDLFSKLEICMISRGDYTVAQLKAGQVSLNVLGLVPEYVNHEFPTDVMRGSKQPACVASPGSPATTSCWTIKPSDMPPSTFTSVSGAVIRDPFTEDSSCQQTKITYVQSQHCYQVPVCNSTQNCRQVTTQSCQNICTPTYTQPFCYQSCGPRTSTECSNSTSCRNVTQCYPVTLAIPVPVLLPNCQILEGDECGKNLAFRFNGYSQMMIAALGCTAKYDALGEQLSNIPVTATLKGTIGGSASGDLPYNASIGGTTPKPWNQYPASYFPSAAERRGYGCVPCRTQRQQDLYSTTNRMFVDQVAGTSGSGTHQAIFSFAKSKAPAECVKNTHFEVRYFGSAECSGTNNPPGHFCTSGNIGNTNCPAGGEGGGSGNIAGAFDVPLCPGSGFDYDHVSVSLSPILIDVAGKGINVSRDFKLSVPFDMKANGKMVKVDWPLNTEDVAFLTLPNKDGKVVSIQELFGDYKAKNGFEALRKYDTKRLGVIDHRNKIFKSLRLWFDRNRDGIAQPEELEELEKHGVASIPLKYKKPLQTGIEGKSLDAAYFNEKAKEFRNVQDVYFYVYDVNGQKTN